MNDTRIVVRLETGCGLIKFTKYSDEKTLQVLVATYLDEDDYFTINRADARSLAQQLLAFAETGELA